jgi:hypothetical protein
MSVIILIILVKYKCTVPGDTEWYIQYWIYIYRFWKGRLDN